METGTCRSCRASIIWAKTPNGKLMPLDVEKFANGNVLLADDGTCAVLDADSLLTYRGERIPLHRSHFASCPGGGSHRKRKGGA